MNNIYKNIEEYNPDKKRKILIAFDDMITDMLSNKNLNSVVTELFIRGRKTKHFYAIFYYENFKQSRTSTNCI